MRDIQLLVGFVVSHVRVEVTIFSIRLARLDDAAAIAEVHMSHVPRWYRQIDNEQYEVSYDDLTLDERFGFGGPWMSVETCAIHLNNLLLRHCLPVVAEQDGRIVAEMELFLGREGPRYGKNCHIGLLFVHSDYMGCGIGNKLIDHAVEMAKEHDCDTLTVASDENHENFYRRYGFSFGDAMASVEVYPARRPVEIVRPAPAGVRRSRSPGAWKCRWAGYRARPCTYLIWRKTSPSRLTGRS